MKTIDAWEAEAQNNSGYPDTKTKNFKIRQLIALVRAKDGIIKQTIQAIVLASPEVVTDTLWLDSEDHTSPTVCEALDHALSLTDSLGSEK